MTATRVDRLQHTLLMWLTAAMVSLTASAAAQEQTATRPGRPQKAERKERRMYSPARCVFRTRAQPTWVYEGCIGYLPQEWENREKNWRALAKWFQEREFDDPSDWKRQTPEQARDPWPELRVAVVHHPRRIKMSRLTNPNRGIVLARFEAKPDAPRDKRYGLGKQDDPSLKNLRLKNFFYLVADPYRNAGYVRGGATQISDWHIYGIAMTKGGDSLVKLPKSGRLLLCDHTHDGDISEVGAGFESCANKQVLVRAQETLNALRIKTTMPLGDMFAPAPATGPMRAMVVSSPDDVYRRLSPFPADTGLKSRQLFAVAQSVWRAVQQQLTDPGWMMCGLGCCSADSDT